MSDEKIVENGAAEVIQSLTNKTERDGLRCLAGKIVRLPHAIRETLNRRMRDNKRGREILAWLNGLAAVKKILKEQFDGKPINNQNLSNWRRNGHQLWLQKQEPIEAIRGMAEDAGEFSNAAGGRMARGAVTLAASRLMKKLQDMPPDKCSSNDITKIAFAVTALVHADQRETQLKHEKTRVRLRHEQVTLQWDKHHRDRVAVAQRVLHDEQIKAIQEMPINNAEKIELLGLRLFGDLWQTREVASEPEAQP
jgi:hypothetical protein